MPDAASTSMDTLMTGVIRTDFVIRSVVADEQGEIWASTGRGLARWTGEAFEVVDPNFKGLLVWRKGKPFDQADLDFPEQKYFAPHRHWAAQFPPGTTRLTAARAADGTHWVCNGQELYTFALQPAPEVLLPERSVRTVALHEGQWWASAYDGLYRGDSLVWRSTRGVHDGALLWRQDTMYVCSYGLAQIPGRTRPTGDFHFTDGAVGDTVWNVHGDFGPIATAAEWQGSLWIGGEQGMGRWKGGDRVEVGLQGIGVHKLKVLGEDLWVLLRDGGANRMTPDGVLTAVDAFPAGIQCHDVLELDGVGALAGWMVFATEKGLGLLTEDEQSFRLLTVREGLPSNVVCALATDDWGNLWASTYSGLVRVQLPSLRVEVFYPQIEFNRFAVAQDEASGDLYFGAIDGLYRLNPLDYPPRSSEANPEFEGIGLWGVFGAVCGLMVLALLVLLVWRGRQRNARLEAERAQSAADLLFMQLETLILARLPNVTVEQMAEELGMPLRTLYRRLAAHNRKPGELLREVKIKRAKWLLAESPDLSLAEVGERVGYSEAHLRRVLLLEGVEVDSPRDHS